MYAPENIALHAELLKTAEEKVAGIDPNTLRLLLHGGAGAVAAGVPAVLITRHFAEKEREQTRNRAFGAGVSTGFAAPKIMRGLLDAVQNAGFVVPHSYAESA